MEMGVCLPADPLIKEVIAEDLSMIEWRFADWEFTQQEDWMTVWPRTKPMPGLIAWELNLAHDLEPQVDAALGMEFDYIGLLDTNQVTVILSQEDTINQVSKNWFLQKVNSMGIDCQLVFYRPVLSGDGKPLDITEWEEIRSEVCPSCNKIVIPKLLSSVREHQTVRGFREDVDLTTYGCPECGFEWSD